MLRIIIRLIALFLLSSHAFAANAATYYWDTNNLYNTTQQNAVVSTSSVLNLNSGDAMVIDSTGVNDPGGTAAPGNIDANTSMYGLGVLSLITGSSNTAGMGYASLNDEVGANSIVVTTGNYNTDVGNNQSKSGSAKIYSIASNSHISVNTGNYNNNKSGYVWLGRAQNPNLSTVVSESIVITTGSHNTDGSGYTQFLSPVSADGLGTTPVPNVTLNTGLQDDDYSGFIGARGGLFIENLTLNLSGAGASGTYGGSAYLLQYDFYSNPVVNQISTLTVNSSNDPNAGTVLQLSGISQVNLGSNTLTAAVLTDDFVNYVINRGWRLCLLSYLLQ